MLLESHQGSKASAQPRGVSEFPEPLMPSSQLHCLGPQYTHLMI